MNFSDVKKAPFTKKCLVRAFKVNANTTNILFDQISTSSCLTVGKVIIVNPEKHIKIKEFNSTNNTHYFNFSIYNPKEKVSITPTTPSSADLIDVDNMDSLHAFLIIKGNEIASLMQISTNWSERKIQIIFESFGIKITPTSIIKKDAINRIKRDGFKALHINTQVEESDFVKTPGFFSALIKNEPALKKIGLIGHLTIDSQGNPELSQSIETNTTAWIPDLDADFYIETKKGEKFKGDDLKLTKMYYTTPYGSKSISSKHAKEILESFVSSEL